MLKKNDQLQDSSGLTGSGLTGSGLTDHSEFINLSKINSSELSEIEYIKKIVQMRAKMYEILDNNENNNNGGNSNKNNKTGSKDFNLWDVNSALLIRLTGL